MSRGRGRGGFSNRPFGRRAVVNLDDYSIFPKDYTVPLAPDFTAEDEALVNNQRLLVNFWVLPGSTSYRVYINSSNSSSASLKPKESLRKRLIREVGPDYFPKDLLADSLAALGVKRKTSPRKDALKASLKNLEDAEKKGGGATEEDAEERSEASEDDESVGAADYEVTGDYEDGDAEVDADGDDRGEYGGII